MIALLLAVAIAATPVASGEAERHKLVRVVDYGVHHHKTKRACRRHGDRHCRKHVHWRRAGTRAPSPGPAAPEPTPTPTPTPTPAPGSLPSRTGVDLTDDDDNGWAVIPAYRELKAGSIEFNANNLGMDDHDFSVRDGDGNVLVNEVVLQGESVTVRRTLSPAVYTLYCSLLDHEAKGMRADITVR